MRCKLKHFFSMLFTNGHITPIIGLSRRNWLDELNPPVSTSANHHLHFNLSLLAVSFTAISRSFNRYQPFGEPLLSLHGTANSVHPAITVRYITLHPLHPPCVRYLLFQSHQATQVNFQPSTL